MFCLATRKNNTNIFSSQNAAASSLVNCRLCTIVQLERFVFDADLRLYQAAIDFLVPDAFSKSMPCKRAILNWHTNHTFNNMQFLFSGILEQLRTFSKTAEHNLRLALRNAPATTANGKLRLIGVLQYAIKERIKLNHMASSVRAYLENAKNLAEMRDDYCRIVGGDVLAEAQWATGVERRLVERLHEEFRCRLHCVSPLEQWAQWAIQVLEERLATATDDDDDDNGDNGDNDEHNRQDEKATTTTPPSARRLAIVGKRFLLAWNYFTDTIVGVLTAKSTKCFAHFHLLRLLYKDYLSNVLQLRIAAARDQCVLALLADEMPLGAISATSAASTSVNAGGDGGGGGDGSGGKLARIDSHELSVDDGGELPALRVSEAATATSLGVYDSHLGVQTNGGVSYAQMSAQVRRRSVRLTIKMCDDFLSLF